MAKKKQSRYLEFKLDKELVKKSFKFALAFVGVIICISFLIHFIIPAVLNVVNTFLSLYKLYFASSDIYIRFFGGCFFLLVMWYVFTFITAIWARFFGWILTCLGDKDE